MVSSGRKQGWDFWQKNGWEKWPSEYAGRELHVLTYRAGSFSPYPLDTDLKERSRTSNREEMRAVLFKELLEGSVLPISQHADACHQKAIIPVEDFVLHIMTGPMSGLTVIDLDLDERFSHVKKFWELDLETGEGQKYLKEASLELVGDPDFLHAQLKETTWVRTPSGSLHLYYFTGDSDLRWKRPPTKEGWAEVKCRVNIRAFNCFKTVAEGTPDEFTGYYRAFVKEGETTFAPMPPAFLEMLEEKATGREIAEASGFHLKVSADLLPTLQEIKAELLKAADLCFAYGWDRTVWFSSFLAPLGGYGPLAELIACDLKEKFKRNQNSSSAVRLREAEAMPLVNDEDLPARLAECFRKTLARQPKEEREGLFADWVYDLCTAVRAAEHEKLALAFVAENLGTLIKKNPTLFAGAVLRHTSQANIAPIIKELCTTYKVTMPILKGEPAPAGTARHEAVARLVRALVELTGADIPKQLSYWVWNYSRSIEQSPEALQERYEKSFIEFKRLKKYVEHVKEIEGEELVVCPEDEAPASFEEELTDAEELEFLSHEQLIAEAMIASGEALSKEEQALGEELMEVKTKQKEKGQHVYRQVKRWRIKGQPGSLPDFFRTQGPFDLSPVLCISRYYNVAAAPECVMLWNGYSRIYDGDLRIKASIIEEANYLMELKHSRIRSPGRTVRFPSEAFADIKTLRKTLAVNKIAAHKDLGQHNLPAFWNNALHKDHAPELGIFSSLGSNEGETYVYPTCVRTAEGLLLKADGNGIYVELNKIAPQLDMSLREKTYKFSELHPYAWDDSRAKDAQLAARDLTEQVIKVHGPEGFAALCFLLTLPLREKLFQHTDQCPILTAIGEAGTGKSTLFDVLLRAIFFTHAELQEGTDVAVMRKAVSSRDFFSWIPEYKPSEKNPITLEMIKSSCDKGGFNRITGKTDNSGRNILSFEGRPSFLIGGNKSSEVLMDKAVRTRTFPIHLEGGSDKAAHLELTRLTKEVANSQRVTALGVLFARNYPKLATAFLKKFKEYEIALCKGEPLPELGSPMFDAGPLHGRIASNWAQVLAMGAVVTKALKLKENPLFSEKYRGRAATSLSDILVESYSGDSFYAELVSLVLSKMELGKDFRFQLAENTKTGQKEEVVLLSCGAVSRLMGHALAGNRRKGALDEIRDGLKEGKHLLPFKGEHIRQKRSLSGAQEYCWQLRGLSLQEYQARKQAVEPVLELHDEEGRSIADSEKVLRLGAPRTEPRAAKPAPEISITEF